MSLINFDPELSGELRGVTGLSIGWDDSELSDALDDKLAEAGLVGVAAIGSSGPHVGYGLLALPGDVSRLVVILRGRCTTLSASEPSRVRQLLRHGWLAGPTKWGYATGGGWARVRGDVEALCEELPGDSELAGLDAFFSDREVRFFVDRGRWVELRRRLDPCPHLGALTDWLGALRDGGPVVPPEDLGAFRSGAALMGFAAARKRGEDPTAAAWLALQTRAGLDHETKDLIAAHARGWVLAPKASKAEAAEWIAEHPVDEAAPLHRACAAWAGAGEAYDGAAHLEAAKESGEVELYASAAWFAKRAGVETGASEALVEFATEQGWTDLAALSRRR